MARLTSAKRSKMPASKFAGPGKSFPINDPEHARLAIGGATRSEDAGNISAGTAARIKSAARAELGDSAPGNGTAPKRRIPDKPAMSPKGRDIAGIGGNPPDTIGSSRAGARDGLGSGKGGLAVHSSLAGHNVDGYEPQHSSKTR